jgi:YD repeat-containing protein
VLTYCLNATFANQQAATCSTGGINATTTTQKDAFGRVATVTEPGGDVTTYAYDVNGKLTSVTQGAQSRTFSYDSAGFLRSETTPERPTVTYASIGSLGNVRTETQPGGLTITRLFDFAGRPTEEVAGGNKYLVNCYDGSGTCVDGSANSSGGTAPNGKLTRRYGYNWIPTIGPIVDEQFTYSGANGRLSQLLTAVGNGDLSATTTQTWTYDGLGMVLQHGHPRASGSFLVTNTETNGLFTKVNAVGTDVVKAAGYNPAAGLSSWTAGNGGAGIVTTIAPAASVQHLELAVGLRDLQLRQRR